MIKGVLKQVQGFLGNRFNFWLVIALLIIGSYLMLTQPAPAVQQGNLNVSVHYFYLPTCPHCHEQQPIIDALRADYPDIYFAYHDVSRQEELLLFMRMAGERGLDTSRLATPTTIIGERAFIGAHSREELEAYLRSCIDACKQGAAAPVQEVKPDVSRFELPFLGQTNLLNYSLPMLAVVLGLIDGFNPCAMWVLVYLIAVVMEARDRMRIWLIVGSFVFASGALYFLFMTAWLNAFLLLGYMRPVTILVGLAAAGGGILSVKEFIETKGKVVCKVGDAESKRSMMSKVNELATAPLTWAVIVGIVVLAFVVNSIEFVCSSAIPAVFTQVLALQNVSALERYAYILLYDFFFMLDDMIIFGLAAFAVSNVSLGEKYAGYCKVIGGALLVLIGAMLLFAPHLLA